MKQVPIPSTKSFTPAQIIVSYYFIAIAISVGLLSLPGVKEVDASLSFIDKVFVAVSAVSVTGLSPVNIADTFTSFGYVIIMMILQLGGIGIMSIGTFIWLLAGKKIGLRERQLIMIDHNQPTLAGVVKLIREIVKILLLIQLVGAIILSLYFMQFYDDTRFAILNGVFSTISATTNGGFDINGDSLQAFRSDYFVQTIHMLLIILGAIGFPVLIEVKEFLSNKNKTFRFSLFTKITTVTYGALLIIGAIGIFIIEYFNTFRYLSWHDAVFGALFHSVSARSGGLTTMNVELFNQGTNFFMSFLMFIGASPSSVGGGIRTTTFAIALLFLINFSRGKNQIQIFGREIHLIDVFRSYAVILLAAMMVIFATILLTITEPTIPIPALIFEITSAFGTCGLSLGVTDELSTVGKVTIMLLMFIGRVGIISFLFTLGGKSNSTKFHYPKERVIIG